MEVSQWAPLTEQILSEMTTNNQNSFVLDGTEHNHYYLASDTILPAVNEKATRLNFAKGSEICLHLNGKSFVSTGDVAIEGAAGKLNIMGSGTVKGNGAADSYCSAATLKMANVGSINLYGGTYEKQTPAAAGTNTVGIGWGGGTVAVYSGFAGLKVSLSPEKSK